MTNELIKIEDLNPLEIFKSGGLDPILKTISESAKSIVPDIETDKGRKELKSMAYAISRTKTTIDDVGKELVSGWKDQAKKVDAERKKSRDFLDTLKEEIREPLTTWENRVKKHEENIEIIRSYLTFDFEPSAEQLQERIESAKNTNNREWEEFAEQAKAVYEMVVEDLEERLNNRIKHESEQAELEELRKIKAEKDRAEELEKAKQGGIKLAEKQAKELKAKEEAETKDREADLDNRKKVNRAALKVIMGSGITEQQGMAVLTSIVKGKVPNVTIRY